MSYPAVAFSGALFGAIGPILWAVALRAGHHVADGSRRLEAIMWIFPTSILFIGFPRAEPAYPKSLLRAQLFTLAANVVFYALFAIVLLAAGRFVRGA